MGERTFNIFNGKLHKAYQNHITDYIAFRQVADKILSEAYFHREISNNEFQELLDIYYHMCEYTGMGYLHENK